MENIKSLPIEKKFNWNKLKDILLPFLALAILVVVFSIMNENFLTGNNISNLLRQMSILLIVALAGTLVILIGSIDLSVGSIVTLSGTIAALTIPTMGVWAVFVGMAIGMIAGMINGLIFTIFKIPSFLVTLGMMSAFAGLSNYISQGKPITFFNQSFSNLAQGALIPGIPNLFLFGIICFVVMYLISTRTVFGRNVFAVGGGEKVAALSGIKINRLKVIVFSISGILCGLAGALLAARIGAGTPRMGDPYLLDSIAAIVIGGTALSGGIGGIQKTIIGVLVITVLSNGMNITGIHPYIQEIVKGIVVVAAVAVTTDRNKFSLTK
ncbi:ABC transporter permease [Ureibacillus endophyticus]|uniref:ABC transporter permease n=1 Tax=Ureibacillus endophyticus TaxID=1978490 RepID=A0A494YY29_9BACL|nr:ABC transporter permease [Lysinibacillus endophyticus]RKQ15140.1 ABC transporter permease [Lysinibacillus endophyticus]